MGLFYSEEHFNCVHYSSVQKAIFKIKEYDSGFVLRELVLRNVFLFVLQGKADVVFDNTLRMELSENEMLIVPRESLLEAEISARSRIITCAFLSTTEDIKLCNNYSVRKLYEEVPASLEKVRFSKLGIKHRLRSYLDNLYECLSDGLGCTHYHECKLNELFFLLRAYYTKEELASFFSSVSTSGMSFREYVVANSSLFRNVGEFAQRMNMSEATFIRHFKKEFGITPYKWMERRKAELLLKQIKFTDKTFDEIAYDLEMSSAAHLSTFCKRHLGRTPSEIRQEE